jgi:acyl-CoA thioesterase
VVENGIYQRHHNGLRLPKELKMMWRQEERPHLKALPKDQRRGWIRARWGAMTEEQKQQKIAELQLKWNALPANVRQNLLEKKRQKHDAKRMRGAGEVNQSIQPRTH